MANDLTKNPWVIDTAATTAIWTGPVHINRMEFLPGASGDDLVVTDKNSGAIWSVTNAVTGGRAGLETIDLRGVPPYQGMIVSTLTSGSYLYVYLD
jgi:hypothetical protein